MFRANKNINVPRSLKSAFRFAMADNTVLLQPGVSIKPVVPNQECIKKILKEIYGFDCVSIKELNGYDDKNYHVQVTNNYDNRHVPKINDRDGYVLKIINSLDSKNPQLFDAQTSLLLYLGKCCQN